MFKNSSLKIKIISLGILASALQLLAVIIVITISRNATEKTILAEVEQMATNNIQNKTTAMLDLCNTSGNAISQMLEHNLNFGWNIVKKMGGFNLASGSVKWTAINQFTQAKTEVTLPPMNVGNQWLGQNYSFESSTPVVDEIGKLANCTATIFQRMNEQGDMLRVATNVRKKDGTRAIGTFIPYQEAEGKVNAVVSTVMQGKTYVGNAFVVDRWYQTIYQPIKDASGKIMGMFYVGIPLETFTALFKAIENAKFGNTGNVIIIPSKGAQKGIVIASSNPEYVGKNLFEKKDAENNLYFQTMLETATKSNQNQINIEKHTVYDSTTQKEKVYLYSFAYFKQFDWLICAEVEEAEFLQTETLVSSSLASMQTLSIVVGIIIMAIIVIICIGIGNAIARPITDSVKILNQIAEGNISESLKSIEKLEKRK